MFVADFFFFIKAKYEGQPKCPSKEEYLNRFGNCKKFERSVCNDIERYTIHIIMFKKAYGTVMCIV